MAAVVLVPMVKMMVQIKNAVAVGLSTLVVEKTSINHMLCHCECNCSSSCGNNRRTNVWRREAIPWALCLSCKKEFGDFGPGLGLRTWM